MKKTIKDFLEEQKLTKCLTNEEQSVYNGISLDSIRSIYRGEPVSQLILLKVMRSNNISLSKGKKIFKDFDRTRDTIKGELNIDYQLGLQEVKIHSIEIIEHKNKALRIVFKNKYTYVKTIPLYSKDFTLFEKAFNINLLKDGIEKIMQSEHIGFINVEDNGTECLRIDILKRC